MAENQIGIATAWAETRHYESQRADLEREAETARLDSRTREANMARQDATSARRDASSARNDADRARSQTERARSDAAAARVDTGIARDQAAAAQLEAEELQRQLVALKALSTDRGLVVTLGDVLFETAESSLKGGTTGDLDTLAGFLNRYGQRTVLIEGHTDSVGNDDSNMSLSQRRADAVMSYLVSRNVDRSRLSATGLGEGSPVASNDSNTGRQQNRRVEVIISNVDLLAR
jgi:outer membrane protein OmpA-like peptidoglycan-associated protein